MLTDWFNTQYGVKQGDTLSPTMCNIYINDIVDEVKQLNSGVDIDGINISILLYADDIVLISDSEIGLQRLLDKVYDWSLKWRIKFNVNKSNVMHIRQPHVNKTNFRFLLGKCVMSIVNQYKYLGVVLNEHIDYNVTAQVLADAGNRALGAIINKYKKLNGLGFFTYSKLYQAGVCPILDYGSEVWGVKSFPQIDTIQNKAMRVFLGVHRFAPNAAVSGDMGWVSSSTRRKTNMVRFFNRITLMPDNRLPRKIFQWDMKCKGKTWVSYLRSVLSEINQVESIDSMVPVSIVLCKTKFHQIMSDTWKIEALKKPKLRTYLTFKENNETEPYVQKFMSRKHRSYLAQFRCGILPLDIETGRWVNKPVESRLCQLCSNGDIEDETHVTFECTFYDNIRNQFRHIVKEYVPDLDNLDKSSQLKLFMESEFVNYFARFVTDIMSKRNQYLFI